MFVSNEITQIDRIEGLITQLITNVASLRHDFTTFRTEMGSFRSEMYAFREEMYAFREEMYAFRDEMYAFRDEMYAFRDDAYERFERAQSQQDIFAGQVSLINQRLDHQLNRIAKVEEDVYIVKHQA